MDEKRLEDLLQAALELRRSGDSDQECDPIFGPAYEALEVPAALVQAARQVGELAFDAWLPHLFPPCAIPLWIAPGGLYLCEWRHWFVGRQVVIADFSPETAIATERARSYQQLGYLVLLNLLEIEGELTPLVRKTAKALGIVDLEDLETRWEEGGDLPSAFLTHPAFRSDLPQSCFDSGLAAYGGDFPAPREGRRGNLSATCSFELHGRFRGGRADLSPRQAAAASSASPLWLRGGEQPEVFSQLLAEGDLGGAWMSLCSSGWTYGEAKAAIDQLVAAHDDLRFKIQAACWSALPFGDGDRY
jgi:hypothetical protein